MEYAVYTPLCTISGFVILTVENTGSSSAEMPGFGWLLTEKPLLRPVLAAIVENCFPQTFSSKEVLIIFILKIYYLTI